VTFFSRSALLAAAISSFSAIPAVGQVPASWVAAPLDPPASCVDPPVDTPRPAFGCFNVAHVVGLQFGELPAEWRLYRFSSRPAAEAARSAHGAVVEEAGAVWLSELVPSGSAAATQSEGVLVAAVGPLILPSAKSFTATLMYAVMSPGQRSRVHNHPGPEAFYVVAGAQCVETPNGIVRASAGGSFSEPAGLPMELIATGSEVRKGFALVLHDSKLAQAAAVAWRSAGRCAL
jgi:quercetin dioxygenase-like cupin family protein